MIVGTAGHIDHGKTTLVRALTGVDTDRLPEEKRRGITIELGFAPLRLAGLPPVGVVDVPGHEAFVRTMLAGATGIDLALLVVAADEGVMPQTREHLAILSLLGVRDAVVALTKCDTVDADWLTLVRDDVTALMAGTPLAGAALVETSAVSGAGVQALRDLLRERLLALPPRAADDLFRMPIDRAFTVKGTGTVVTGTIWSGRATAELPLRLFPADRPVRARGVQSHGESLRELLPGSRAAIALAAVELSDVERGGWLVEDAPWQPTRVLRADVALLDDAERALRPREWVRLHLGTTEVGARVVAPGGALVVGERRGARLVLDAPLVARAGDRFVLRRPSPPATIGGGVVTDPMPAQRRVRPWPAGLDAAQRLAGMVAEAGERGVPETLLAIRLGVAPREAAQVVAGVHGVVRGGGRLFARTVVTEVEARLTSAVQRHHTEHPLDAWAPRAAVRAAVPVDDDLAALALDVAIARGTLELGSGGIRRPGWSPTMSVEMTERRDRILERLESSGAEPPSVSELRSEGGGHDPIPLLRNLERDGSVVQVEPDRFYAAGAVRDLVGRLRSGMAPGREYGPAELRELLGTSRKYLIPFLEYCDRQRITERRLDGRVLG
jgi:selenocysteine-specific elongation factor